MGTICSRKTKLPFESHGWTSVEHDIWWKQQVKCLGARPLYWQIIFGHPLSGFVLKNGAPKVWKMLILKCPAMRNGTDLRRLPQGWVCGVRCLGLFPKKNRFFLDAFPKHALSALSQIIEYQKRMDLPETGRNESAGLLFLPNSTRSHHSWKKLST